MTSRSLSSAVKRASRSIFLSMLPMLSMMNMAGGSSCRKLTIKLCSVCVLPWPVGAKIAACSVYVLRGMTKGTGV